MGPIKIHLHKNIPIGSGLGSGSSNAVFMLMMLNNLFSLKLGKKELLSYSKILGSDCAFFITNNFSRVSGIGDIINPIDFSFKGYYVVVFKPEIHCSTHDIFSRYKLSTQSTPLIDFDIDSSLWKKNICNDSSKERKCKTKNEKFSIAR